MLGDRLAREHGAVRQPRDGLGPALGKAGHQLEARRISKSPEDRGGSLDLDSGPVGLHGFWRRWLSMFFIWLVQPPSFILSASALRATGMRSKPDSVRRSRVPPSASSSLNSTRVMGSLE